MKNSLAILTISTALLIQPLFSYADEKNNRHSDNARLRIEIHNHTAHTLDCTQNQKVDDGTLYNINAQRIAPENIGLLHHAGNKSFSYMRATLECRTEDHSKITTLHYSMRNTSRPFMSLFIASSIMTWFPPLIFLTKGKLKTHTNTETGYKTQTHQGHFQKLGIMHRLIALDIQENTIR